MNGVVIHAKLASDRWVWGCWFGVTSEVAFYLPVIITVDNLLVVRVGQVSQEL